MAASGASGLAPPLVSVIVPTFNRLQYLRAAIESVFDQSYPHWELRIADDGSAGETREYLRTLGEHPRVRIAWMPHTGIPAVVRNAALRQATGNYVAFLDSDDLWASRKLQAQVSMLQARPECQWAYTAFTNVDQNGTPLPEEASRRWAPCEGRIFERMLRGEVSIRTPTVLARRLLLMEVGAFDESLRAAEDYDLWFRLALRSEVALVDEPLVRVRAHADNHSRDWSEAYAGQDRTFGKLQRLVDRRGRASVRKERARNSLRLASQYANLHERKSALRALGYGVRFSWPYAEWWDRALRIACRVLLSERMLENYRRWRKFS